MHLDPSDYKKPREVQFRILNKKLYHKIQKIPELQQKFGLTDQEVAKLKKGKKPRRLTWHHHQEPGRMELVDKDIHADTGHTGGQKIWGPEK